MYTLFFTSPEEIKKDAITLDGLEARHAISVLRVRTGEVIRLADGLGNWVEGEINSVAKESLTISVTEHGVDRATVVAITAAQALLKGDNQKAALDQLVQAGVDSIIPWRAFRSIGAADKSEKWQEVIRAAAKQSRRSRIPNLLPKMELHELSKNFSICAQEAQAAFGDGSIYLSDMPRVLSCQRRSTPTLTNQTPAASLFRWTPSDPETPFT